MNDKYELRRRLDACSATEFIASLQPVAPKPIVYFEPSKELKDVVAHPEIYKDAYEQLMRTAPHIVEAVKRGEKLAYYE